MILNHDKLLEFITLPSRPGRAGPRAMPKIECPVCGWTAKDFGGTRWKEMAQHLAQHIYESNQSNQTNQTT